MALIFNTSSGSGSGSRAQLCDSIQEVTDLVTTTRVLDMRQTIIDMGYTPTDQDLRTLGNWFSLYYFQEFGSVPTKGPEQIMTNGNKPKTIIVNEYTADHLSWIKPIVTQYFADKPWKLEHQSSAKPTATTLPPNQQTLSVMWTVNHHQQQQQQ
eukprot:2253620-Rhodomonas_salina.1